MLFANYEAAGVPVHEIAKRHPMVLAENIVILN